MPTPDYTHNNTGPTAVAGPARAGTAGAPTGVDAPDFAGGSDAPGAITLAATAGTATAPTSVAAASFAGTASAPGSVALAGLTPTASTPQQVAAATTLQPITDSNMHTANFQFVGKLKTDQPFGFYQPPAAGKVVGLQLFAQTAPTGADVIVDLTDADGTSLARSGTIEAGNDTGSITFGTPLAFLAGAIIRAEITQVGSGTAGSYLTANLIIQLD